MSDDFPLGHARWTPHQQTSSPASFLPHGMTFYEHIMLGTTGVLATGLDRRYGWSLAAMAGVVAMLPDWDGLSLLAGGHAFDLCHRVAGHNLLVATLVGILVALAEYRYQISPKVAHWLCDRFGLPVSRSKISTCGERGFYALAVWLLVGVFASWSHLASDLIYSSHARLGIWELKLLWPFSDNAWAFPMISWGDIGITVIFAAGMFAMARWPGRRQGIAMATLMLVSVYIVVRGTGRLQLLV